MRAVQGSVHVAGSSRVYSYCSSSGTDPREALRHLHVARGPAGPTRQIGRLDHQRVAIPVRPRGSHGARRAVSARRRVADRDQPRLVVHLLQDGHVLGSLEDLIGAVVAASAQQDATAHAADIRVDANHLVGQGRPFGQGRGTLRPLPRGTLLRLRDPGRQAPVRGIDDQRRPVLEPAAAHPELVVAAGRPPPGRPVGRLRRRRRVVPARPARAGTACRRTPRRPLPRSIRSRARPASPPPRR